jgi:phage shock protein A
VTTAEGRARRELDDSRAEAEKWEQRKLLAETRGDARLAADAAREADRKRARMHTALEELSRLTAEKRRLLELELRSGIGPSGPSDASGWAAEPRADVVDEMLESLKRRAGTGAGGGAGGGGKTVDEELQALKKRMQSEKPGGKK